MYKTILQAIFLFLFFSFTVNGQIVYPDGAISTVNTSVENVAGDSLKYTFKIYNEEISTQVLSTFVIYIDDSTLSNPPLYTSKFYLVTPPPKKYYIDGVVVPNAISGTAANRFLQLPPENGLNPGEVLEFSVQTTGLPSINKFQSEGFVESYSEELIDTLFALGFSQEEIFYDLNEKSYSTFTVSPKLWPDSTTLHTFTDTLETFRFRSCEELEWAKDASVCAQLEDNLSEIKAALVNEDSLSAANALNRFIELVEAEKEGSLTSEGYALLYFNAQYLAERLPEPEEPSPSSGITCECANPVAQSSGTITFANTGETKCIIGTFSGSVFFQNSGTLEVCGTANLQNIYGNQPGQIAISETGEVTVGNWNNNYQDDNFTNWGSVTFSNWTTINNGTLTNHGEMNVNGGLNQNNGPLVNSGTLAVSNSITLNQPGNVNEGSIISGGTFTLNSNAEFVNSCRVQSGGQFMLNGLYTQSTGALTGVNGLLTINSNGTLVLNGMEAMITANQVMLNGTIHSTGGPNLITTSGNFNTNSSAVITTDSQPLYLAVPTLSSLSNKFNVADGNGLTFSPTTCNPSGFNTNQ